MVGRHQLGLYDSSAGGSPLILLGDMLMPADLPPCLEYRLQEVPSAAAGFAMLAAAALITGFRVTCFITIAGGGGANHPRSLGVLGLGATLSVRQGAAAGREEECAASRRPVQTARVQGRGGDGRVLHRSRGRRVGRREEARRRREGSRKGDAARSDGGG